MPALGAKHPSNASARRVDMRRAAAGLALAANRSKLAKVASTSTSSTSFSSCFLTSSSTSSSSSVLFSRTCSPRFSSFIAPRAEASASSSSSSPSAAAAVSLENLAASHAKRPPRFFVEPSSLNPKTATAGSIVTLPPTEARHARKVLRLRPGASVELCDGRGGVAVGKIMEQKTKNDPLNVELSTPPRAIPPASPRLVLAVAALGLKGGRGDWLVEKAAELGASSLVPLSTERSPDNCASGGGGGEEQDEEEQEEEERRRRRRQRSVSASSSSISSSSSSSSSSSRVARWRRLADAAGKQCLRPHALEVFPTAVSVDELARRIRKEKPLLALVAAEGGPPVADVVLGAFPRRDRAGKEEEEEESPCSSSSSSSSSSDKNNKNDDAARIYLIVGPEGDFTPSELEALVSAGAKPCGLGSNRLRVETASEALLAVASALLL